MLRIAQICTIGVVIGLLGVLVWKVVHTSDGIAPKIDSGETGVVAPEFTRPRLDTDGNLSLASTDGKVRVLNFWASWCIPCAEEAPELEAASKKWRDKGVVFIGINGQDLRSKAREFMDKYDITYPNVVDNGNLMGRYGVGAYPETFFVTAKGVVVGHLISAVSTSELDREIRRALRQ